MKTKGTVLLLSLSLGLMAAATSCSHNDPDYSDVTPPEAAVYNDICGAVAGMDGVGLVGATITITGPQSGETQTDSNG